MSDYVSELERELRAATYREYARVRTVSRWRRWPVAAAAAMLLIAGSAAAAIVALSVRSGPLTGAVPGASSRLLRYDVPVTPDLEPGFAGWCSYPRFWVRGASSLGGGGACAPAGASAGPIIVGGGEPISNVSDLIRRAHLRGYDGSLELTWFVVSSTVAAIRLGAAGAVVPRPDPRLPAGWKAVATFLPASAAIGPIAIDARGRVIPPPAAASLPSGALTPVRTVAAGVRGPEPCAIATARLPSLGSQWEVVAARAPALGAAVAPNALFSCARAWFSVRGQTWAASAAVLVGARDPGRPAPVLPGLRASGTPGVFLEDGGASGTIVARRVGRAWLVAQGQSLALSVALVRSLRVKAPGAGG